MINISRLVDFSNGDKVKVVSNATNHNYQIGTEYTIVNDNNGHGGNYLLSIDGYNACGNWIGPGDITKGLKKDIIIEELSNILEFLKDYEGDIDNAHKLQKEYKVFHILKEIKSEKSDFEKISIISKYI